MVNCIVLFSYGEKIAHNDLIWLGPVSSKIYFSSILVSSKMKKRLY